MTKMVQNSFGVLRSGRSLTTKTEANSRTARRKRSLVGRTQRLLVVLCFAPAGLLVGCSVLKQTHETVHNEHVYTRSNRKIEQQMKDWAKEAWLCHCGPNGELLGDKHFECGFEAGFVRYLRTGDPNGALMPPPEYMKAKYVSIEGRNAINRWIEGHALGMIAAEQSGYRDLVKIPVLGVITPNDLAMPVAESVVVDAVIDPLVPPPAPVEPPLVPSPLPGEEGLTPFDSGDPFPPTPGSTPPAQAPTDADVNDPAFDAFLLPDSPQDNTTTLIPESDPSSSDRDEAWHPTAKTEPADSTHVLSDTALREAADEEVLASDMRSLSVNNTSDDEFQWLGNLSTDPPDDIAGDTETEFAPPSEGVDSHPQPDADGPDSWLHPPETPSPDQDAFGFPESPAEYVIFEDENTSEPSQPEIQQISNETRAGARRYQLYKHFAAATKPATAFVDDCVQPDLPVDDAVDGDASWPQLDKVMSWPEPE